MKSIVVPFVLALLLAAAGSGLRAAGRTEEGLADMHRALLTLQFRDARADAGGVQDTGPLARRASALVRDAAADARSVRAAADYWQAGYSALQLDRDATGAVVTADPQLLFLAANAEFRASQAATDRSAAVRGLDTVVKSYGELLKADGANADAAYNYEYAIRLRDIVSKGKGPLTSPKGAAVPSAAADAAAADLPAGPTLHGLPGGPPPAVDMNQFRIVIPKRGEERNADPEAGKGGTKIRRG